MSIVDKFIKNYTDSNKERIKKIVDEIDALAPKYRKYKDSDIKNQLWWMHLHYVEKQF